VDGTDLPDLSTEQTVFESLEEAIRGPDAQCGNGNRPLHTDATVAVLDRLLARL